MIYKSIVFLPLVGALITFLIWEDSEVARRNVRFVALFTALTLLPIAVIYYFAGQFVSKGVDSWFDVKIEQALDDASLLGKSFLEASKQTLIEKAQSDVARVAFA